MPLNEYTFPPNKIANVQNQLEKLISKNYYLHQSAKEGYRSYIQAYGSYSLKRIYDIHALDLAKVAKAFGFAVPPKVNVTIGTGLKARKERTGNDDEDSDEPQGKRQRVDRRSYGAAGREDKAAKYRPQKRQGGQQWSR